MKRTFGVLICILLCFSLRSEHLVGGDIGYTCLGGNDFVINLSIYRDCQRSQTPLDNPAYITVYNNDNRSSYSIPVNLSTAQFVPLNDLGPCVQTPPTVCIEGGTYQYRVTLTPNTSGYTLIYQRCCRNNSILNLNNPGTQGATYAVVVPPQAFTTCNNTPTFKTFPPLALCINENLVYDHSATDVDGDSLVYDLCPPLLGADQVDPAPDLATNPPYDPVFYNLGYNELDPFGPSGIMAINPATGILTATPTAIGQYVIGVCVTEYRNGVVLSQYFRDFQFNVANCNVARARMQVQSAGISSPTDVLNCKDSTVTLVNQSTGNFTNYWEISKPGFFQSYTDVSPSPTLTDTGTYQIKLVINRGQTCQDSTIATLRIYPRPTADFNKSNVACEKKDAVVFTNTSTSVNNNITGYLWNFGNGVTSTKRDTQIVYPSAGNYNVTLIVTTSQGCKDTLAQTVSVLPQPVADFSPEQACSDVAITINNTTSSSVALTRSDWTFTGVSGTFSDTSSNPVVIFPDEGIYTGRLIVENGNGCRDTVQKDIQVFPTINASFNVSPMRLCMGEEITVSNTSTGIIDQFTWYYDDGSGPHPENDTIHKYTRSDIYSVTLVATNNTCGNDTAVIEVEVTPTPEITLDPEELSLCNGVDERVRVSTQPLSDSIVWSDGLSGSTVFIDSAGKYFVSAWIGGCKSTDSLIANDFCLVHVASAFSPNGDGQNDRFNIIDKNVALFQLDIYNIWKEKLFSTNDINNGWDGTYKGEDSPVDVYIYFVSGIKNDGQPFEQKGVITLIR